MNTKNLFVIDCSKSSIVASATTLKKARKPESSEYRVLTELLCAHPYFCDIEKDIQKKPGKKRTINRTIFSEDLLSDRNNA